MFWPYRSLTHRYVLIAMEALDQLLMACHSQSIKPFVESFLHMVAKLLESGEPKLQVLGTNSVSKAMCLLLLSLISISMCRFTPFWECLHPGKVNERPGQPDRCRRLIPLSPAFPVMPCGICGMSPSWGNRTSAGHTSASKGVSPCLPARSEPFLLARSFSSVPTRSG